MLSKAATTPELYDADHFIGRWTELDEPRSWTHHLAEVLEQRAERVGRERVEMDLHLFSEKLLNAQLDGGLGRRIKAVALVLEDPPLGDRDPLVVVAPVALTHLLDLDARAEGEVLDQMLAAGLLASSVEAALRETVCDPSLASPITCLVGRHRA